MTTHNGICISGNMYYQFKIPWSNMYNYKVLYMECSMFSAVYIHNLEHLLSLNVSVMSTCRLGNLFFYDARFSVYIIGLQVNTREGIILLALVSGLVIVSGFVCVWYNKLSNI
jgi:hypothetical protein